MAIAQAKNAYWFVLVAATNDDMAPQIYRSSMDGSGLYLEPLSLVSARVFRAWREIRNGNDIALNRLRRRCSTQPSSPPRACARRESCVLLGAPTAAPCTPEAPLQYPTSMHPIRGVRAAS